MKFDLSTIVLIVIACMLAYITYVSMTMVKASVITAKVAVSTLAISKDPSKIAMVQK